MKIDPANVKIILVDDAKTMRKIERKILNSLGYTNIIEAGDGVEAKMLLQKRKDVSIILSDWNMPNMSGFELLVWIRTKSRKFNKIPFIMVTANIDDDNVAKMHEHGVTDIVAKPFVADELQVKLERALNQKEEKENKQVSLSSMLFEKGVSSKTDIDLEQLQLMSEKKKELTEENDNLRSTVLELQVEIATINAKIISLFKEGVAFLKAGDIFEAAGKFNGVLAFEPENMKALNNLAVIYHEMEMREKAKSTLQRLLELDPENKIARENFAALR